MSSPDPSSPISVSIGTSTPTATPSIPERKFNPLGPWSKQERKIALAEVLEGLVLEKILTKDSADKIQREHRMRKTALHPLSSVVAYQTVLPGDKPLTLDMLSEWLAKKAEMKYFPIDPLKVDFTGIGDMMSLDYAVRYSILPVSVKDRVVTIATSEPFIGEWVQNLKQVLRMDIVRVVSNPDDIVRYIDQFFRLARSVKSAKQDGNYEVGINNFEQLVDLGRTGQAIDANEHHVVHVVDWLFQYAYSQRASDIHLEPRREQGAVRFRIDGVLQQVYEMPPSVFAAITSRIKILGRMDVAEKRRPQDGRIKTRSAGGEEVELRLSTLPTAFGEKLVMRIFDPDVLVRSYEELGFNADDLARWRTMTAQPHGIVLVTGPTGSGKTVTLYTTLKSLATSEVNVCTIEDPIEMIEPSFNQLQVQTNIDLGFADGLRALMRQDPDIIMVGEIRDLDTAEMAIQAALTGHLVFSTLHTNDTAGAVTRLLDLGVPAYLINATVLGIMAQRLVRTLCPECKKVSTNQQESLWNDLVAPFKANPPSKFYQGVGCMSCRNTGFKGRIGIYEIMPLSLGIKRLITDATDIARIREQAFREGMRPLRVAGALKVAMGLTSLDEIMRVAPPAIAEG